MDPGPLGNKWHTQRGLLRLCLQSGGKAQEPRWDWGDRRGSRADKPPGPAFLEPKGDAATGEGEVGRGTEAFRRCCPAAGAPGRPMPRLLLCRPPCLRLSGRSLRLKWSLRASPPGHRAGQSRWRANLQASRISSTLGGVVRSMIRKSKQNLKSEVPAVTVYSGIQTQVCLAPGP